MTHRIVVKGKMGQALDQLVYYRGRALQGRYYAQQGSCEMIVDITTADLERWWRASSYHVTGALVFYTAQPLTMRSLDPGVESTTNPRSER